MKITMKKSFAVIMAFVMCVSVLFGMNLSAFASTNTVTYVKDGSYVYNWGQRETEATFLSPMALDFYAENNISLDELLALNGSSSESSVPSSTLYKALQSLMKDNHDYVTNYEATKNLFKYTDCQNSGGKISSFYSGTAIGPEWNSKEWNREHVWPNSKGDKAGNGENDLMMLRPTSTSENSSRGNKAYGTTTTTSYYNPNDEGEGDFDLRGDCARIILYQYVRWECTNTGSYNPNSIFGANGVIESKKVLLDWIEADPVDTWELGRNDAAESILGTRNIFVDYPELAFDLLDVEIPKHQTPSGYANGNGTDDDVIVDEETGNEGNGGDSTGIEGGTITYEIIDGIENLTAGTYKMAAYCEANGTTNFSANPYHCFTGTVSSGDLVTNVYSFTNGNLTKGTPPDTKHTGDAVEVSLISVESKANTYYIYIDGKGYLYSTSAANRKLAFTNEPKEWVATNHTKGGITMTGSGVSMGSAGASSTIIRSYANAGTLKYGLFFFKATSSESGSGGDQGGYEPDTPTNAFSAIANDDTCGTVTTNGNVVTVTPADGYKLSETEPYLVEGGEATVTDNGNGTYTISNVVGDATISFNFEAIGNDDQGGSSGGGTTTETVEVEATIDFTTTTQRVSQDTSSQVWTNDGLTFTNNKSGSSTNVANYSNPIRLYANSTVTIDYPNMHKIVIDATSVGGTKYATPWVASCGTFDGTAVIDSNNAIITITFNNPVDTFTITASAQIRAKSLTAYATTSGGTETPEATITPTVNNTSYGSVELSGNYIIATPNEGYEVVGCEIVSGTATVTQNGNKFTVEADADVTVQINFAPRTQYTVTFKEQGNTTSTQTAYSGDQITLPSITAGDYTVAGWVTATIDGETTEKPTFYTVGSKYTVTANTTLHALYSRTAAGGGGESNVFTKYTGAITEGDYLIVHEDTVAMSAGISSDRFTYSNVTVSGGNISNPDESIIWHITSNGDYWTIYNESVSKYAASTGAKNKGKLSTSVDDYSLWTTSGTATYEFVNKKNKASSVNANLRYNSGYGFATYATGTGKALTLYKRTAAALTTYYFTGAVVADYTVTANANDDTFGTVTVSGTTISATPNAGYIVAGYSIVSGTATVTREGNTFFATPTSNVEITINFETLPTYTVTFIVNGEEVDSESAYSGGFIKLPEYSGELDEYTTFDGWAEKENETDSTKIYAAKATYAVTKNVTLYAQFTVTEPPITESASHYFLKVTEGLDDLTGVYLIVNEGSSVAFNGGITDNLDVASNNLGVTISSNKIAATSSNMAAVFIITKNTDGTYNIRSQSGFNIGSLSDTNSLLSNANKTYVNTISIDADGNAVITGEGGAILRYNTTSNQNRFRFYKTSSYSDQKPIALYKLETVGEFSSAQVSMGADLGVKYAVDVTSIDDVTEGSLKMRFTVDDTVTTVIGTREGNQYTFDFAGLSPQRMGDNIKAELLLHDVVVETKAEYSIRQNALNLLEAHPENDKLKQFVSDMLYYGAAAQKYSGYKKNNLVTDGLEDVLNAPLDEELTEEYNKLALTSPTTDVRFKSATVWFDVVNKLIVKVNNPNNENIKVYVTRDGDERKELDYNASAGTAMTDEIKVTDFQTTYTFEIVDENNNVLQTLTYSVNTYAYSRYTKSEDDDMVSLALALFRLGRSAEKL